MMRFRKGDGERSSIFSRRAMLLGGGQAVLLSALAARLYELQVLDSRRFATMAEDNRISLRLLAPSRGLIFDRTGQPLAVNRNNYRAMVSSDRGRGAEILVERLDQILGIGEPERNRLLRELRRMDQESQSLLQAIGEQDRALGSYLLGSVQAQLAGRASVQLLSSLKGTGLDEARAVLRRWCAAEAGRE